MADREEISRGLASGWTFLKIAKKINKHPSTVGREVKANGGRAKYRPQKADRRAAANSARPKVGKLVSNPRLAAVVRAKLVEAWSPERISRWLVGRVP